MSNIYTIPGILEVGTHAARPAANAIAKGCLYAESDTNKIFQSDGSSWSTWLDASASGAAAVPLSTGTTAGDMLYWTASATVARLASAGTTNKWLRGANAAVPTWDYPPGYEFDYVQRTTAVNITNTGATPDTILTANAVTYDGSTTIIVEFCADQIRPGSSNGNDLNVFLYDGSTKVCYIGYILNNGSSSLSMPASMRTRLTPSAASHTYSIRASVSAGTGTVSAGSGTGGGEMPAFIRQTKAA